MNSEMKRLGSEIIETLERNGHEAFFVGGCVRDSVLGRPVKDMDIATSAAPEVTAGLFVRIVPTGLQHGTITVLLEGHAFEVTTFRRESEYENHRRPAGVEFITNLEEDLKRRDFTINAMAMNGSGHLIDPMGGLQDLSAKRIRAVGDPCIRFKEDALRMLRGVRFAADFGFSIEKGTAKALRENAPLLVHVAMERVRVELERMIAGSDPFHALKLLANYELLRFTKKPLNLPIVRWGVHDIPQCLRHLVRLEKAEHRWMLFCKTMDMDAEDLARELDKLTFSRAARVEICRTITFSDWLIAKSAERQPILPAKLRELWVEGVVLFGAETLRNWLKISEAELLAVDGNHPPEIGLILEKGEEWIQSVPALSVRELDISGPDLLNEVKLPPGPWVGNVLKELLWEAALGKIPNQKADLLDRGKVLLKGLNTYE